MLFLRFLCSPRPIYSCHSRGAPTSCFCIADIQKFRHWKYWAHHHGCSSKPTSLSARPIRLCLCLRERGAQLKAAKAFLATYGSLWAVQRFGHLIRDVIHHHIAVDFAVGVIVVARKRCCPAGLHSYGP